MSAPEKTTPLCQLCRDHPAGPSASPPLALPRDKSELPTKRYYGASLAAFEKLGREKGYRLVMVEPSGVHAYLLRNDVAADIPASPARALHPYPGTDTQPLFDQLANAGLPLVDVASAEGELG